MYDDLFVNVNCWTADELLEEMRREYYKQVEEEADKYFKEYLETAGL